MCGLKISFIYLQAQKTFEISKNVDWQQHTYWKHAGQTFLPLCGLSASLCAKINSPADVTDQTSTQSPVISTANYKVARILKILKIDKKIEEITYNYSLFTNMISNKRIL